MKEWPRPHRIYLKNLLVLFLFPLFCNLPHVAFSISLSRTPGSAGDDALSFIHIDIMNANHDLLTHTPFDNPPSSESFYLKR